MPKIGFTVGIWDRLHSGHINILTESKLHCDHLVVGIMNDYWCNVQKGHNIGIQSLQLRMENLRNSNLADKIIILDTLDMYPYLQMADVWIKGEDQKNMKPDTWNGTVYIKRTEGISSTKLRKSEKI